MLILKVGRHNELVYHYLFVSGPQRDNASSLMYILVVLSQVGMQLVAEWHRFQLKKSDPVLIVSGVNKIVKITGHENLLL